MKLIIDIDDKTYKGVKQFYDNMSENECISEYELAIAEGIPLKNELGKLKEKINSEDIDCQYEDDYLYSSGLQKALEIIDKHIEEQKGE